MGGAQGGEGASRAGSEAAQQQLWVHPLFSVRVADAAHPHPPVAQVAAFTRALGAAWMLPLLDLFVRVQVRAGGCAADWACRCLLGLMPPPLAGCLRGLRFATAFAMRLPLPWSPAKLLNWSLSVHARSPCCAMPVMSPQLNILGRHLYLESAVEGRWVLCCSMRRLTLCHR